MLDAPTKGSSLVDDDVASLSNPSAEKTIPEPAELADITSTRKGNRIAIFITETNDLQNQIDTLRGDDVERKIEEDLLNWTSQAV